MGYNFHVDLYKYRQALLQVPLAMVRPGPVNVWANLKQLPGLASLPGNTSISSCWLIVTGGGSAPLAAKKGIPHGVPVQLCRLNI